ncbi:MAG: hypothetical protein IJT62_05530 [Oscillospiraceae bacterium]|nr:hypothetical protein [Oscillospiraceae bacterium]
MLDIINERQGQQNLYSEAVMPKEKKQEQPKSLYARAAQKVTRAAAENNLYARAAQDMAAQKPPQGLYSGALEESRGNNAARGTSEYLSGIYDKADNRESSLYGSTYADILNREDYGQNSQAGESRRRFFGGDNLYDYINNIENYRRQADMAEVRGMGEGYGKYAFMTEDEIGVYNYIYATEGKKAANRFLEDLEPELNQQWYSGASRNVTDMANQNTATKILASAGTVLAQPARTITSAAATGEDMLRSLFGLEIDPYSGLRTASRMSQDIRGSIAEGIDDEKKLLGISGRDLYNAGMSAADSAVNSFMAAGIAQGLQGAGAIANNADALAHWTNVLGSGLMSSEVTSMGIAEAKEKGWSNEAALVKGMIEGGIEYASEAIGGEWAIRRIKTNPGSFLNYMLKSAVPEGVEELMSDAGNEAVNLLIDSIWGTRESMINQYMDMFRAQGSKNPEMDTLLAILQNEWKSFAGGALSAVGTGAAHFSNYKASANQIAEKLNTNTQTLGQLMDETGMDLRELGIMTELSGAESVEELRQRIRNNDQVNGAVEASMAQQGAQQQENDRTIPAPGFVQDMENAPAAEGRGAPGTYFDISELYADNNNTQGQQTQGMNQEGALNNGEASIGQTSQNGNDGLRAGEQGQLFGQGEGAQPGGEGQVRQGLGQSNVEDLRGQDVTPAELGIETGSSEARIHLQTDAELSENAREARQMVQNMGYTAVPFTGEMILRRGAVNAVIDGNTIYYRTDAVDQDGNPIDWVQTMEHEVTHPYTEGHPDRTDRGMAIIGQYYTAEQLEQWRDDYRETYKDIYDFENMTEEEIRLMLENELFGDAFSANNAFRGNEALREEMHRAFPEILEGRENADAGTTDPRALAAQKKSFNDAVDRIVYSDDNKPFEYDNIVMRNTPKVLLDLGFSQLPMTITSKHIYTIANGEGRFTGKNDHYHNLGAEGVKSLFNGIETPVLAYVETMPDDNNPARIVMIVPVVDKTGQPVMVGVECAGSTRVNEITVIANPVTTAYGKNENTLKKYIEDAFSEGRMLYADKERSQYLPAGSGPNDLTHFEGSPYSNLMASVPDMLWSYDFSDNVQRFRDAVKRFQPNKKATAKSWREANKKNGPRALAAGINAKTANSTTLQQAEQMERDGASNEEIRQATTWYRGADGKWRFEIDDSGATYHRFGDAQYGRDNPGYTEYKELMNRLLSFNDTLSAEEMARLKELDSMYSGDSQRLSALINMGDATLEMILDHPALYEAYPELRNAKVQFADLAKGQSGAYNRETNTIKLSNDLINEPTPTLLHEIQHQIQAIEGFTSGASPQYWNRGDNYSRAAQKMRDNRQSPGKEPDALRHREPGSPAAGLRGSGESTGIRGRRQPRKLHPQPLRGGKAGRAEQEASQRDGYQRRDRAGPDRLRAGNHHPERYADDRGRVRRLHPGERRGREERGGERQGR